MRIQTQLDKIERDLAKVAKYVSQAKTLDAKHAFNAGRTCDAIIIQAAIIGGLAREVQGMKGAKKRLVAAVREALGYTYP